MSAPAGYYENINRDLFESAKPLVVGKSVLEVGCAGGHLGQALKAAGAGRYVGVEVVASAADAARTRLDEVICGSIETLELPFPEGEFDCLIGGDVFEHLVDPWAALTRCVRFVKRGGHVIASIPNVNHASIIAQLLQGKWTYADEGILDRTHLRFFTLETMLALFGQAGLAVESAVSCTLATPAYEALVADLDALRRKYDMGTDRFATEAVAFQWIVTGVRM